MSRARDLYRDDPEKFSAEVRAYADKMRPIAGNLAFGDALQSYLQTEDKLERMGPGERHAFERVLEFQLAYAKTGEVLSYSQAEAKFRSYGLHEVEDEDQKIAHLAKQLQSQTGRSYKECLSDAETQINRKSQDASRQELKTYH